MDLTAGVFKLVDALEDSDDVQNVGPTSTCPTRCYALDDEQSTAAVLSLGQEPQLDSAVLRKAVPVVTNSNPPGESS